MGRGREERRLSSLHKNHQDRTNGCSQNADKGRKKHSVVLAVSMPAAEAHVLSKGRNSAWHQQQTSAMVNQLQDVSSYYLLLVFVGFSVFLLILNIF